MAELTEADEVKVLLAKLNGVPARFSIQEFCHTCRRAWWRVRSTSWSKGDPDAWDCPECLHTSKPGLDHWWWRP